MPGPIVPGPLDHVVAALLLLAVPLLGRRNYRRFREEIATGGPDARRRQYWKEIRRQWAITAALAALWVALGRSAPALGLSVPLDIGALWGAGITALVLAFLLGQWRAVQGMSLEKLAENASQIEGVRDLLPHTDREARVFRALALTAGVCEEIVFRGWLIAYLAAFLTPWPAAVVGGVAFGAAHAYQGLSGVLKTGATGIVTGLLYVGTGSLLWSMLIHTAIDLHGGAVGRRLIGVPTSERG